jgi:2-iminobutanoate/2-iminopropanoate deaminase
MIKKTPIAPPSMAKPAGVWSPAIVCEPGRLLFISGMTARDGTGDIIGVGDYRAQTRQVCENLKAAIEAAGGTMADVARVDVFVLDIGQFDTIHAVRREYFPSEPPASTMVQVQRLVDKRMLIEINAIAVL